ncbi:MAG: hypothetical protein RL071_1109 [Pseudomonadota bacterium]|jgi:hypothetical protein
MKPDPRRMLEEAAQRRIACELLLRGGGMVAAQLVRVERGGVVVTAPLQRFAGGEDVRVWVNLDGQAWTFEASVIRAGVPVPDRSQSGLLLGFIDRFQPLGAAPAEDGRVLALVPPRGQAVSLLHSPAQLLQLSVEGATFAMPSSFKLIFVESGTLQARIAAPGAPTIHVKARVHSFAPGDGHLLYELRFEQAEDPDGLRQAIDALAATVDR